MIEPQQPTLGVGSSTTRPLASPSRVLSPRFNREFVFVRYGEVSSKATRRGDPRNV